MSGPRRCRFCRRPLKICNKDLCTEKLNVKEMKNETTYYSNMPIVNSVPFGTYNNLSYSPYQYHLHNTNNSIIFNNNNNNNYLNPYSPSNNYSPHKFYPPPMNNNNTINHEKPPLQKKSEIESKMEIQDLYNFKYVCSLERKGIPIFRRFHLATVTGHTEEGFLVRVSVKKNSQNSDLALDSNDIECNLEGVLVKWNKKVLKRWKERPKLLDSARERVAIGSSFMLYAVGICDFESRLNFIMATHPSPILKFNMQPNEITNHTYPYLIVIDLEATCDYSPEPIIDPTSNAEIIEFPWVVIDCEKQKIVDEGRFFVKPDLTEGFTPYCAALTGIKFQEIQNADTLEVILGKFTEYIKNRFSDSEMSQTCYSFRIVTDGMWDLQLQLLLEAKRKNIKLDWWFREYFNLKKEFQRFFPFFNYTELGRPSLASMLKACGLSFVGHHHSGLDDCKTISQLILFLLKHGHSFHKLIKIPKDFNPLEIKDMWSFPNVAPTGSWKCPHCNVYNRPSATPYCYFCKAFKSTQ